MKTDLDTYMDEAFRKEPDYLLTDDFADKMAAQFQKSYSLKESLHEYSIYASLILGLTILVGGFFLFINKGDMTPIQAFISGNIVEIISVVFVANFILFTDKVLLRMLFVTKKR